MIEDIEASMPLIGLRLELPLVYAIFMLLPLPAKSKVQGPMEAVQDLWRTGRCEHEKRVQELDEDLVLKDAARRWH